MSQTSPGISAPADANLRAANKITPKAMPLCKAAVYVGLETGHLRELVNSGGIPHFRAGGKIMITVAALDQFLVVGCPAPSQKRKS